MSKASWLSSVSLLAFVTALPASSGAQTLPSPSDGPATSPLPEPPPAEPAAPIEPTAPAPTVVVAGVPLRFYGILHAMAELTQGVQSFDNATAVAPTSALNPAVLANPDQAALSLQIQQTRLGMKLGEGTQLQGTVEFDFTHFDQSSPTTTSYPRVRIMALDWTFAPRQRFFMGQTWDLFGNATGPQLLSHSFNLVGTLFRAGNIGFMRHQIGYSGRFDDVEVAFALGMPGSNAGPTFNNLEQGLVPTGSARVMLHLGDAGVVGASGIVSALRFSQPASPDQHRVAAAGELFTDVTLGPVNVHSELYLAQNLANAGALNLGFGRYDHDLVDLGGYVSAKITLGQHAFTAMAGAAAVLNADEVVPGYAVANPTGTPPTTVGMLTSGGSGITRNFSAHVGYWFSPLRGFSLVAEPYVYVTKFRLAPVDAERFDEQRVAFGGMLGTMYTF